MNHLSHDRIAELAEGATAGRAEERHLAVCPTCAGEMKETAALLGMIRSGEDAPLPKEGLELNATLIDARIASIRPRAARHRPLRWNILVPLAAAAVAVVLPRTRDSARESGIAASVQQAEVLSADEFDVLVRYLASATEELEEVQEVIDLRSSPWEDIEEMSGDELEKLLSIMGVNGLG